MPVFRLLARLRIATGLNDLLPIHDLADIREEEITDAVSYGEPRTPRAIAPPEEGRY
jgi:hypothetical protein